MRVKFATVNKEASEEIVRPCTHFDKQEVFDTHPQR
jgi:hypothetical protein